MLHSRTSTADYPTFPRRHLNNTPNAHNRSSEADLLISRTRENCTRSRSGRIGVGEVNISPVSCLIRRARSINRDGTRPHRRQPPFLLIVFLLPYLFFDFQQGKVATNSPCWDPRARLLTCYVLLLPVDFLLSRLETPVQQMPVQQMPVQQTPVLGLIHRADSWDVAPNTFEAGNGHVTPETREDLGPDKERQEDQPSS